MLVADHEEAWEMKPRKLTPEEIERPEKVIEAFFQYVNLPEMRAYLWEGMKRLVTETYSHLRSREKLNLIYFYEQVEKVMEVMHVIHERKNRQDAVVCKTEGEGGSAVSH